MNQILTLPSEYIAGLGLELITKKIEKKIDEKKLKSKLRDYICRQQKYNEVCTLAEEIDFQGIVEYIQSDLIDDAYRSIFAVSSKERGVARKRVVDAAICRSNAYTGEAKRRVAKLICSCIDIIKGFYRSGIPKRDYFLATEIVDAVHTDTEEIVTGAAKRVENKMDSLITTLSNGSMYSLANMIEDAKSGKLEQIGAQLTKAFDHMSVEHPLYPHYGYTWENGNLISVPRTREATIIHPPRYVLNGTVHTGDHYFTDASVDLANYAYRHQITLTITVHSAKKYLGTREDPSQAEVSGLIGKKINAKPPAFPPALPCSVMVKDTVFYEYVLFRMQEIMDDGTIILGNREQCDSHIIFEFSIKLPKINDNVAEEIMVNGSESNFTIQIHNMTNKEYLNYIKFIKALNEKKPLRVHALNSSQDLFICSVNSFEYQTGFRSPEEEIDFLQRICTIEDHFHVQMTIAEKISEEEYKTVVWISNLIMQDEVESKWSEATCTGIINHNFREKLVDLDSEIHMLSYVGNTVVKLFGAEFEFKHMRTYKCAVMQDFEKIKRKTEVLDDGDELKIIFKPGDDDTVVDTLRIPDTMSNIQ